MFSIMRKYITILFFCSALLASVNGKINRQSLRDREHSRYIEEEPAEYGERSKAASPRRLPVGDHVVDKFVETLLSSERYLKLIETVALKLQNMETFMNEKTNKILKYLSELLKVVNISSADSLDGAIKTVLHDLGSIKKAVKSGDYRDTEYRGDGGVDARLASMETAMKSIHSGVDTIVSTISEVKNRQFDKPRSDGPTMTDSLALINEFRKSLHERRYKKCDCNEGQRSTSTRVDRSERYPTDCHEIQMQGFNVSGIYKIRPEDMNPFYVLCDLTTSGGGWTVFQNRFDGSQDFYKSWNDYEYGFGNLAGEFWLGLDKLNYLTNQKLYELRIELECQNGQDAYAGYSVFTIGPHHEGYRISTLGTFYGTAGDSLSYHAGQKFSTYDVDNDEWRDGACASEHGGAWWYKECDKSNLNGKYGSSKDGKGSSIYWISFKGPNVALAKTKMMIRPLPASKPIDYPEIERNYAESKSLAVVPAKTRYKAAKSHKNVAPYENRARAHYAYTNVPRDIFFPNFA